MWDVYWYGNEIDNFVLDYMAKTTIDFKTAYGSNFLQGNVTSIDLADKYVVVDSSDKVIKYTDLVIAVGSSGPFPGRVFAQTADEAAKQYTELGNEVKTDHTSLNLEHFLLLSNVTKLYINNCFILSLNQE